MKHLSLRDFRNYEGADVELDVGTTVFVGPNGQGKTNLVEAISYLSTVASHRTPDDSALIRAGTNSAVVRALLGHGEREVLVEVELNRAGPNRGQLNRSAIRVRELPRYFSSVLFAPEDLTIIRGDPSVRRRFVDQLLTQRTPRLAGTLADYERVVKQRNSLLKSARAQRVSTAQLGTLDIWDERLSQLGSEIIDERQRTIELLATPLVEAYRSVAGVDDRPRVTMRLGIEGFDTDSDDERDGDPAEAGRPVAFRPVAGGSDERADSRMPTAEIFRSALATVRRKELERGVTLLGPHRDELLFELNGLPVKGYASHGESWSFALALRLASAALLRAGSTTGDPVLILDDVFAELDAGRRRALASAIADYEQVLITAAVVEDVPAELDARRIRIRAGEVVSSDGR